MNVLERHDAFDPTVIRPYSIRLSVLPFDCFENPSEDARLARGFCEDMVVELARFPSIGVIAAHSMSAFVERHGASAGPLLAGVDYFVRGSIRRASGTIRVSAQLVEARTGRQLWADRYDRPEQDVFSIQDEITVRVANALHARIDEHTLQQTRHREVASLAAYESWRRGFEELKQGTLEANAEARRYFEHALELDPHFARGYLGLALSHLNEWSCSAWERWDESERRSYEYAQKAAALDAHDALVHIILGRIQQYRRQFDAADHHFRQALQLAPNDAETLIQLGMYFGYQGDTELAVKLAERSLDLNPHCPNWQIPYVALSRFMNREYEGAASLLPKTDITLMVDLPAYGAATFAYLARGTEARAMIEVFDRAFAERILRGRPAKRDEPLLWLRHVNPYRRQEDVEHFIQGVVRARAPADGSKPTVTRPVTVYDRADQAENAPELLDWPIANIFRRDGELWTLSYDGHVVHLPDAKGLRDIAYLLAHPAEEVHSAVLAGRDTVRPGSGCERLDDRARREYEVRITDLRAEMVEADMANDPGRKEKAREEFSTLVEELERATGLGGRVRKLGDDAERARSAVTWRVRSVIKRLLAVHPTLGRHLSNSVQTGNFCRYAPEKPVEWEL